MCETVNAYINLCDGKNGQSLFTSQTVDALTTIEIAVGHEDKFYSR